MFLEDPDMAKAEIELEIGKRKNLMIFCLFLFILFVCLSWVIGTAWSVPKMVYYFLSGK